MLGIETYTSYFKSNLLSKLCTQVRTLCILYAFFINHRKYLEQSVFVRGRLNSRSHDETADGEVVELRDDGDGPPQAVQGGGQLAHGHQGLTGHGPGQEMLK